MTNHIGGHEIHFDESDGLWKYCDTKESIYENPRSCIKCGNKPTELGHDYCLRNLGRVANACCGHGKNEGYIMFEDGTIISGYFKVERPDSGDYFNTLHEETIEIRNEE